ncbi:hypothetical protein SAMN05216371_7487 [Streptomyces sp. TLI_053]|uniref:hypothetical protein n=1 Tax=Streptomyces sp. TLI_053 TaxID=1855352 RepID=UPI0008798FA8|nr:hypothetical protein [Streptomyces sp. TLI_053]SDT82696.1 hypothetical protein SAMN05216371_7487 [Streptomyces sp. TLI_053]
MKTAIRHHLRAFARQRPTGTAHRTAAEPLPPKATGASAFARERPWTAREPFWCITTAYYSSGHPLVLWSAGAPDVRLAARQLQRQVARLTSHLRLGTEEEPMALLDTDLSLGRACTDVAAGRSHAVAFTHADVIYVLVVARSDGTEQRLPGRGVPCPA